MATRKDLLKAQSFTSRRMIASFINRDPDDPTPPLRRVGMATFVSVLLGIVLVAGYTLLGLLKPGSNPNWKTTGIVISDTESGALFVYEEQGDMLVPMADVASARLKAAGGEGGDMPKTSNVKTEALSGMTQAPMEGIPGAPRQLPAPKNMAAHPLKMCSTAPNLGGERFVTLDFDAAGPASSSFAFVAQHSDRSEYLIFGGKKHRLWTDPTNSGLAMVTDLPRIPVGNAWIAAMPEGLPIQPLDIKGLGDDNGRWIAGMARGDIGRAPSDNDSTQDQYFVQTEEGIVRISYLDADALIQKYHQGNAGVVRTLGARDWKSIDRFNLPDRRSADVPWDRPAGPPQDSSIESKSVCATWTSSNPETPTISYGDSTPKLPSTFRVAVGNAFDFIEMPTLTGALLRNASSAEDDTVTFLITDRKKYAIPSTPDRAALGYKDLKPVPVPGGLLSQIPDGLAEGSSLKLGNVRPLNKQPSPGGN
ncbi:MAG: type VII secretion protein EccB [Propionibacteriaceae bacterium]|nr:type VII secretion protein EccB [Propionibacteriaceae bacterium]